jgi:hypothetical protein
VEVALDAIAVDEALRQRSRPVRARVVGHVKFAVEVEDGEREPVGLDLQRFAAGHVGRTAQPYPRRARTLHVSRS